MSVKRIIVITGATASGKSQLAIDLVNQKIHNGVIINADAQQVYQHIPIITAQPSKQELAASPHYLYGHLSINISYSVGKWLEEVVPLIIEVSDQNKIPILVGGSGMYISSLINGISEMPNVNEDFRQQAHQKLNEIGNINFHNLLSQIDPECITKIEINDSQRLIRVYEIYLATNKPLSYFQKLPKKQFLNDFQFMNYYLSKPRQELYNDINKRFLVMIKLGVFDEIKNLMKRYYNMIIPHEIARKAIGIYEINNFLNHQLSYEKMIEEVSKLMRHYAKRQLTWFNNQFANFNIIDNKNFLNQID